MVDRIEKVAQNESEGDAPAENIEDEAAPATPSEEEVS
jgi:hypothetical protein